MYWISVSFFYFSYLYFLPSPIQQIILSLRHSKVLNLYIFSLVILLTKKKAKLFLLVKNSMDFSQFFLPNSTSLLSSCKGCKISLTCKAILLINCQFYWSTKIALGDPSTYIHTAFQNPMQSEIQFLSLEPSLYDP